MAIIQLAGSPLGYAGVAAAPVADAAMEVSRTKVATELQMARNNMARREAQDRMTRFSITQQQREADDARKRLQAWQEGMVDALKGGAELGFDTNMGGLQSMAMQVAQLGGAEQLRGIIGAFGMPASERDPIFPLVYNTMASLVPSLYEQDERRFAEASRAAFLADAESYGFAPDDVDGVLSLVGQKDAPDKSILQEAIDRAYTNADTARKQRIRADVFKKRAETFVRDNQVGLDTPEVAEAYGRLVDGVSKTPGQDLLRIMVESGGEDVRAAYKKTLVEANTLAILGSRSVSERTRPNYRDPRAPQATAANDSAQPEDPAPEPPAQPPAQAAAKIRPDDPASFDWRSGAVDFARTMFGEDSMEYRLAEAVSMGFNPTTKEGAAAYIAAKRKAQAAAAASEKRKRVSDEVSQYYRGPLF